MSFADLGVLYNLYNNIMKKLFLVSDDFTNILYESTKTKILRTIILYPLYLSFSHHSTYRVL